MRAVVWDGTRLVSRDDLELRTPVADEVVVQVDMAGLCHSDLKPMDGDIPQELPVVLGHEAVGRVIDRGPDATVAIGTRVAMTVMRPCGTCPECRRGRRIHCRVGSATPPTPFSIGGQPVQQFVRLGAFARQTLVSQSQVIPMPEGLSDQITAMLSCATVTAFGAVEERARVESGDRVLVIGAGGIGLNVVIAARAAGSARIVVCDRNPRKEAIAKQCGATDFIIAEAEDLVAAVLAIEPEGYDAILECVGRVDLLDAAVRSLSFGGRVVIVGLPPHGTVLPLEVRALFNDRSILGCRMGSIDPWKALPQLAERCLSGEIDLQPLVSATVLPDQAATLVEQLRAGTLERGFIDFNAEGSE